MWKNIDGTRPISGHYSVMKLSDMYCGMIALRAMFPDAKADDMNFVLFSTGGVHGTRNTIENAEAHVNGTDAGEGFTEVTFTIIHPRLVVIRYGTCTPETPDDIDYLKRLRASSHAVVAKIGIPKTPNDT